MARVIPAAPVASRDIHFPPSLLNTPLASLVTLPPTYIELVGMFCASFKALSLASAD